MSTLRPQQLKIVTGISDNDNLPTQGFIGGNASSAGYISGGTITDAGGATIDVSGGEGYFRTTDSDTGTLVQLAWTGVTAQAIPSDTIRYVGVEYNAGSPQVVIKTTDSWDHHTDFRLGSVANEVGILHPLNNPWLVANEAGHSNERFFETVPFERANRLGGLIIGETGTRNVTLTAGKLYDTTNEFTITSKDTSGSDTFDTYVGTLLEDSAETQWDNLNYNNSGVLNPLGASKWANLWWYIEADNRFVMLYGTAEYNNMASAELESPPSTIPLSIQSHGKLLGRFVFQQNAATATISSVFDTTFTATGASDHLALTNLVTGDAGHTQFGLLGGRSGGQTLNGGTATTETLVLKANTADSTQIALDDTKATLTGDLTVSGDATIEDSLAVNTNITLNNETMRDAKGINVPLEFWGREKLGATRNGELVSPTGIASVVTQYTAATTLSTGNILFAYSDNDNSNYGTLAIYDNSGAQVVAPTVFVSADITQIAPTTLINGNVLIAYRDQDNSNFGTFIIVDDTGSQVVAPTVFESANTAHISCTTLTNGNIIIAYNDGGNSNRGTFVIYDSAGSQVVAPTVFETGDTRNTSCTTLTNGNFFIAYTDWSATSDGTLVIYDNTGNQVVAPTVFDSSTTNDISCTTLTNGNIFIAYSGTSSDGSFVLHDSVGNQLIAPTFFNADNTLGISTTTLTNGNILIAYRDGGNSDFGTFVIYNSSGTEIQSATVYESAVVSWNSATTLTNGNFLILYRDDSTNFGTFVIYEPEGEIFNGPVDIDNIRIEGKTISSANTDGDIILSPNGVGDIDVATSTIKGMVDPTTAQEGATKNYVDTHPGIAVNLNNVFFINKAGSDSNNGRNLSQTFFTIAKGLTDAGAVAISGNEYAVVVVGADTYTENLSVPPFVQLYAPGCTIKGLHSINSALPQVFGNVESTSAGNAIFEKVSGVGNTYIKVLGQMIIGAAGSSHSGVRSNSGSITLDVQDVIASQNAQFIDQNTNNDLYITVHGNIDLNESSVAILSAGGANVYLKYNRITQSGTGVSLFWLFSLASTMHIEGGPITVNTINTIVFAIDNGGTVYAKTGYIDANKSGSKVWGLDNASKLVIEAPGLIEGSSSGRAGGSTVSQRWGEGRSNEARVDGITTKLGVGGADTLVIDTSGRPKWANLPEFRAAITTSQDDKTGDGTDYTIIYDNEKFDRTGDYDHTTGVFTVPTGYAGNYKFTCGQWLQGIASVHTVGYVAFLVNSTEYKFHNGNYANMKDASGSGALTAAGEIELTLAVTDTVAIRCNVSEDGGVGSKVVDFKNTSFSPSWFTGRFISVD